MEQLSSSKVSVEFFDPYDVYKLLAPGLIPRLPLRDLHWQSHSGPLRSIPILHVDIVPTGSDFAGSLTPLPSPNPPPSAASSAPAPAPLSHDDGFQPTSTIGGVHLGIPIDRVDSTPPAASSPSSSMGATLRPPPAMPAAAGPSQRRHQIPGLRRTPYLKVLFVRCDDNDTYKATTRAEIREWIKTNTVSSHRTKSSSSSAENHDAFEWLIVHVVIPNTAAAGQPRTSGGGGGGGAAGGLLRNGSDSSASDLTKSVSARWRGGSTTLLEKLRSDFNGSGKSMVDRVAQIRIGINDVPYEILPRVVPVVPAGYQETEKDSEAAWADLMGKLKAQILLSFDSRVTQYEEDIKEKDAQRALPGWNFCTFFILKEGLARGFESVGLVEDALVGYDELSVGLDTIVYDQAAAASSPAETHGGGLLSYTTELREMAQRALGQISGVTMEFDDVVDLQQQGSPGPGGPSSFHFDDIPISSTKKKYRELIVANNVSLFDFRCYIFARQVSLLLRLGNAWSTREELLGRLREQQESVLHGVAPRHPVPKPTDEAENLSMLAEICKRALEFIPAISIIVRRDALYAVLTPHRQDGPAGGKPDEKALPVPPALCEVVDNMVASFAFSVAQQILAQTSTKALPIPPSTVAPQEGSDGRASIPDVAAVMHPARSASLHMRPGHQQQRPQQSPTRFPGPGRRASVPEGDLANAQFLKAGLEELAAGRADLYTVSRNVLEECGKKRGWIDGWANVPVVGDSGVTSVGQGGGGELEEVSLDADDKGAGSRRDISSLSTAWAAASSVVAHPPSLAGLDSRLLQTALDNQDDFYRLYETMTDKSLRHYTIAGHTHSVQSNMADLAVLKFHLRDYAAAAAHFYRTIPFFGESRWSLLELSMLVMYARCLKELRRMDDYVNKALLKLLIKAAAAERERMEEKSRFRVEPGATNQTGVKRAKEYLAPSTISGFLADLLAASETLEKEIRIPLASLFSNLEVGDAPAYDEGRDSFSLFLHLQSLLVDEFEAQKISMRINSLSSGAGGPREIWLQNEGGPVVLGPGRNTVQLKSNITMAGNYEVDQILVQSKRVSLHFERQITSHDQGDPQGEKLPPVAATLLKNPRVTLYQRTSSLDVRLVSTKHIQLDKNNELDLEILTGWNAIKDCQVKIRSGTGGLRLLIGEAQVLGLPDTCRSSQSRPPGGGGASSTFTFGPVPKNTTVKIRFPFSVEQDLLLQISVRAEVTYTTDYGIFVFSKTPSVPISLALGVNVQDIFKHDALYSRFTVSTASVSPLRLFGSELIGSDMFETEFGCPPGGGSRDGPLHLQHTLIFPKQPANLLYRVVPRNHGSVDGGGKTTTTKKKTMYLKLYYTILQDEVDELLDESIRAATQGTPLWEYSSLVVAAVTNRVCDILTPPDLERAGLLGELRLDFMNAADEKIAWERVLAEGGVGPKAARELAQFLRKWAREKARLTLWSQQEGAGTGARPGGKGKKWGAKGKENEGEEEPATQEKKKKKKKKKKQKEPSSITIPVDVPPVTVVHTVDIRIHQDAQQAAALGLTGGSVVDEDLEQVCPTVCINQLLPATLHLKWTRMWDMGGDAGGGMAANGDATAWRGGGGGGGGGGPSTPVYAQAMGEDMEFSYEVTAPPDTWLLGGRRRGHFVIPAVESAAGTKAGGGGCPGEGGLSSAPDTEADIPLLLVPLREGWLPYPMVEVREVRGYGPGEGAGFGPGSGSEDMDGGGSGSGGGVGGGPVGVGGGAGFGAGAGTGPIRHVEVDHRNLGETVRVVADRRRVTLSLDASGPGGGPLVLEMEKLGSGEEAVKTGLVVA